MALLKHRKTRLVSSVVFVYDAIPSHNHNKQVMFTTCIIPLAHSVVLTYGICVSWRTYHFSSKYARKEIAYLRLDGGRLECRDRWSKSLSQTFLEAFELSKWMTTSLVSHWRQLTLRGNYKFRSSAHLPVGVYVRINWISCLNHNFAYRVFQCAVYWMLTFDRTGGKFRLYWRRLWRKILNDNNKNLNISWRKLGWRRTC